MLDLKTLRSALEQLEEERGIPQDKILGAIEDALVAAYKKDYGKKTYNKFWVNILIRS